MSYDYIVIGGGIAGLYANYILSMRKPQYNGILLERESILGGRAFEFDFYGTMVKPGAGIMEKHNKRLLRLLKKLNIKPNEFKSKLDSTIDYDINDAVNIIKKKYKTSNSKEYEKLTMEEFLVKYFGKKFAKDFIKNCEYQDWLKSDVDYFINYYKIDDMKRSVTNTLIIQWNDLVNKLKKSNCFVNNEVTSITKNNSSSPIFTVKTKDREYTTKKIILAVTLKPLNSLLSKLVDINYNDYIGTVPFVRIYAWYKNKHISNL